jgi:N-acetylglucosamine-6-phosphate deacetylase
MTGHRKLTARRIFDGDRWHEGATLLLEGGRVLGIAPGETPAGPSDADLIVPGFVDLQVNGGGGVQFNADPTPAGIATICNAHLAGGTTALLVTLITGAPDLPATALSAVARARQRGQPGLAGVHLEGPHFAPSKKGAHDPAMIRAMEAGDIARIVAGMPGAGHVLVTVSPGAVSPGQIADLAAAGVQVSLGHSDTDAATAQAAFAAGASMVTHLFNAMSGLGHREPGLVGAALDEGAVWAGIIADGHHVDPLVLRIALRAKRAPGRLFFVSDAMAVTGSDLASFTLDGRKVLRQGGRLTLTDGTLAGADITMLDSVRYGVAQLELPLEEALRMATLYPAQAAGLAGKGRLEPGADADFLLLSDDLALAETWIGGHRLWAA